MTVMDVVNAINSAASSTGVSADFTAGAGITLRANQYGSLGNFTLSDANGVINAAGTASATGVDAVADVVVDQNGATAGGLATVTFTGGRMGFNGLTLTDSAGNSMTLTESAMVTISTAFTAGHLKVGSTQFQIGANANQTANMSLGNFVSSELGKNIVAGKNLSNLDLTTTTGANDALKVIDGSIEEIARSRGDIGNFQRNVLESNIRSLGVARENLSATESTIRDIDVAAEMTHFTKLQILMQSGMAVLSQANVSPQSVLALLG
jgi:flagellin